MQPPSEPIDRVGQSRLAKEAERIRRASKGDSKALIKLYEMHLDPLYSFIYMIVKDISEAEEVTSETFTRAIEALVRGNYKRQNKPFGTWLQSIAVNVLQERNRASRNIPNTTEMLNNLREHTEPPSEEANVLDILVQQEEGDTLWQLVRELSVNDQRILVLRHVYGLSYKEIAKRLGHSETACKQLHYQALIKLKVKAQETNLWRETVEGENEPRRQ